MEFASVVREKSIVATLRALRKLRILRHLSLSMPLEVNSASLKVPVLQGVGLDNFTPTEPWLTQVVQRLLALAPTGAFVDVGVNVGQTLLKVKGLEPSREYWGFEPNPVCYCYATELIRANAFKDCHLYPIGLADEAKVLQLFSAHPSDSSASMVEGFRDMGSYSAKQPVPVFAGDAVFAKEGITPALVKIDVEGGELEVVRGLMRSLADHKPYLVCEILPVYSAETERGKFRASRQRELEGLLHQLGYRIRRILPSGETVPMSALEIHGDVSLSNYVFVPKERPEL